MKFVFDLDDTLLDTNRLLQSYIRDVLLRRRVSWAMFQKARELDRERTKRTGVPRTTKSLFDALGKVTGKKYSTADRRKFLHYINNHAHRYYFSDVFEILPKLNGQKILLTRGDRVFQEAKIQNKKFRALFDRLVVTPRLKVGYMKKVISRGKRETIIFVDDFYGEHEVALPAIPAVHGFHIIRHRNSRPEGQSFKHHRYKRIRNLRELYAELRFIKE